MALYYVALKMLVWQLIRRYLCTNKTYQTMQSYPYIKKSAQYAFCYIFTLMMLFACGNDEPLPNKQIIHNENDSTISQNDTIKHSQYNFDLYDIPIVEENYVQCFLGNVVDLENSSARHITSLPNPQYNKVSTMLSYGAEFYEYNYIPNLLETQRIIKSLKENDIEQNEQFTFSQNRYNTLKEIRLAYGGKECISLDSLWLQNNSKQLLYQSFIVYSLNQVMAHFSLADETENILSVYPVEKNHYGCINSITLGKICYVIAAIESHNDDERINTAVSIENNGIVRNALIITFDNQCRPIVQQRSNLTKEDILNIFNQQPIRPLYFNIYSMKNGAICTLRNSINIK